MSSISGEVLGAALMTIVPEALRNLEVGMTVFGLSLPPLYGLSQIIMAVTLILIIFFRPRGLAGTWEFSLETVQERISLYPGHPGIVMKGETISPRG